MLKVLDLFSGIGGFSLGLERTGGFETVAFCEIDPYCRKVLAKHWPGATILEDVRKVDGCLPSEPIDVVCGGFPCQPWSLAGKREGTRDDRDLWPEMRRLIGELKPRYVIAENVPGLDDEQFMGLDRCLSDLEGLGYEAGTLEIPACAVGAPHRRSRLWIVGHAKRPERWPQHQARNNKGTDSLSQRGESPDCAGSTSKTLAHAYGEQRRSGRGRPNTGTDGRHYFGGRCAGVFDADADQPGPKGRLGAVLQERPGQRSAGQGGSFLSEQFAKWEPEPDVGGGFDGISTWMDGGRLDGEAKEAGCGEILRAMRDQDGAPLLWRSIGGLRSIQEKEILQSSLCQSAGAPEALGNLSLAGAATSQIIVRGVWFYREVACPSCRRTAEKQRAGEHSDALHLLPQLLACDCGSTWLGRTGAFAVDWRWDWEGGIPRIATGVPNRVSRLKALGNAVIPQIPEIIGNAILEAEGLR